MILCDRVGREVVFKYLMSRGVEGLMNVTICDVDGGWGKKNLKFVT